MSLVAHETNSDGAVDIVPSDRKGPRRGVLWFQNMPGSVVWPVCRVGPERESEAMSLDLTDLNGDALTDVVLAVWDGPIQSFLQHLSYIRGKSIWAGRLMWCPLARTRRATHWAWGCCASQATPHRRTGGHERGQT